jgi:NAD(P)-dependent dehydrogenase (short-subunit alcohol dehydrogenase family)
MVERAKAGDGGGSLAVTGSVSAVHGAPQNQAYASAKAGVGAMVRGIAVEYARHGVRANVIQPGWVRSDMTARLQEWDAFNKKAIGRVPMQRWGEADDYAGLAVYLASDVSRFHTGDTLVIDGGYSIF